MKKELIIQEPIFLTELLTNLLKAGFITRFERVINNEWRIVYEDSVLTEIEQLHYPEYREKGSKEFEKVGEFRTQGFDNCKSKVIKIFKRDL